MEHYKHCPNTLKLLQDIPSIKAAMFAYLPSGARLVKHRDPYDGSLRYHLGLKTPNSEQCQMIVDGETRYWKDGESMLFDETFIHYADNQSKEGRLILLCDIERPMRFIVPLWINRIVAYILLKAATAPNEVGDKTGWINKAFSWVYYIRIAGKWLKSKNKYLYQLSKYGLIGCLIYFIFFSWY